MKKIIIAIDGFSSCGKSTMAKDLAKELGYIYVDTGAMYRAVTLYAMRHGIFSQGIPFLLALQQHIPFIHITFKLDPQSGYPHTLLNDEDVEDEIRSMDVSSLVSPIATINFIRTFLVTQQQKMGSEKGIVMDGRDIGTVVFPEAELKIFVTATAHIRAQRRFDELKTKGVSAEFDEILKNVEERDYIDSHRENSPLRKADDAIELDNSDFTLQEQKEWLLQQYKKVAGE